MLPIFCLRLASGLVAALLLLPAGQLNQRFYRTHFLTALGLSAAAAAFVFQDDWKNIPYLWAALGSSLLLSFAGAICWSLDKAPGGKALVAATTVTLAGALLLTALDTRSPEEVGVAAALNHAGLFVVDELSSAALLGASMTAMLLGHSYLIAPTMSITPLLRLLSGLFVSLFVRAGVAGTGLWFWTGSHSLATLNEVTLLLPLRWGLGFVAPLVLGFMAWQTARIRSTQSATGILYVVVIFCFLGELMGQLLARMTGGALL
jgi:hypothetical protein